jgi:hypothetical protein
MLKEKTRSMDMRNCNDIEPIMLSYISGDVLGSQKRILDEHLKECSNCAEEVVRLQRLDLNLIDLKEEEGAPPAELKNSILSELEFKSRVNLHKIFSPTLILSSVTVVLAVLVFILAGKMDKLSVHSYTPKAKAVKILFFSKDAQKVSLVGDFNGWGVDPLLLKNVNNGTWEAELKLSPGMYQYNIIVDGKEWVTNPNSKAEVPDGFGGTNSVMIVNGGGENKIENTGKKI